MRRNTFLAIILVVAMLSMLGTYGIHSYIVHKDVRTVGLRVTVGDYVGFDTNTSALIFGTVPPGGQSMRFINVTHDEPYDMHVTMAVEGNISGLIRVSEQEFIVGKGESRRLKVYADPDKDIGYGDYSGTLYLYFQRVW